MPTAAMATPGATQLPVVTENEALIESSFRKLLSSIESERERIRGSWQQIEQERDSTTTELERIRNETQEWCYNETAKIETEWKRLDRLSEAMGNLWPEPTEVPSKANVPPGGFVDNKGNLVLDINCSGTMFTLRRSTLCGIEGSYLAHMFSDAFINEIPKDTEGRFYLDYNPHCFAIVADYLQMRRLKADAPVPSVPINQQHNMDMLAEALKLKPFLTENKISTVHGTSLVVTDNVIQAMHPGWQVISSQHPFPVAVSAYVEIKVLENPDALGGLAFGVCGHIPTGKEVHSIRINGSVLYNSNNGLIGDAVGENNVVQGVPFREGSILGLKHDVDTHSIMLYHNRTSIGTISFKPEWADRMQSLYPVFALYVPGQTLSVDFNAKAPADLPALMG